jgi:predicted ATP-dependent protease
MSEKHRVAVERLHQVCDPASLGFSTTDDLEVEESIVIGQDEAMSALSFGVSVRDPGYGIFVLGDPGSGRFSFARRLAREHAKGEAPPPDWCYVYNFDDPRRPRALQLPSGRGPELRAAMAEVVTDLRRAVPQALESDSAADRRAAIVEQHGKRAGELMEELRKQLEGDERVGLVGTPDAMVVVPARGGEPLTQDAYRELPADVRDDIDEHVRLGARAVLESQRRVHQVERVAREEVANFHRELARQVVTQRLESLRDRFEGVESVLEYVGRVAEDIVQNADAFLASGPVGVFPASEQGGAEAEAAEFLKRYRVNPLVTHTEDGGAPVIEESNPNLRSLFGRTEGQMRFGIMVTDFTQIAAGAAHRANGGYLLVRAEDVLSRPLVWPALKRTLRTRELRPVDAATETGLFAMQSLEPEPIPADLTVILIGEPNTYYILQALDAEFDEVFKVKVDFASEMDRLPDGEKDYARLIATECARKALPPFDAQAVARLIDEGSRLADDQTKLTTRLRPILDLMLEAGYVAGEAKKVTAAHVQAALDHQDLRRRRPERRLLEMIERGFLAFEPTGEQAGQLYGIGLTWLGDAAVGRPIRVMASAYMGRDGLVNIEREVELSGRLHNKGFLVVTGYLGRHFARHRPLTLSGTLSFDQLYEEVEGDSASAAELFALISAVGEIPIRQGIAVTGAVNQDGMILPVGGVTDKIEGYFKACVKVGLSGNQGVVIPARNLDNLCLGQPVRDAIAEGRFHLWAIDRVEDGWPILSGLEAGHDEVEDQFPEGTVHHAVQVRLDEWADLWEQMSGPSISVLTTPEPVPG